MTTQNIMHKTLDTYDKDEVRQAALDHLTELLHKIALSTAAKELDLYVPTLARVIDDELPLQAITYVTAAYIVFMCECNVKIKRILDEPPRSTAYYSRTRLHAIATAKMEKKK